MAAVVGRGTPILRLAVAVAVVVELPLAVTRQAARAQLVAPLLRREVLEGIRLRLSQRMLELGGDNRRPGRVMPVRAVISALRREAQGVQRAWVAREARRFSRARAVPEAAEQTAPQTTQVAQVALQAAQRRLRAAVAERARQAAETAQTGPQVTPRSPAQAAGVGVPTSQVPQETVAKAARGAVVVAAEAVASRVARVAQAATAASW